MIQSSLMTTGKKPDEITYKDAIEYIRRHKSDEITRLERLESYYNGKHDILKREKSPGASNRKVVINLAAYIADFTSGYLLGEPVTYVSGSDRDISAVTDMLKAADSTVQDIDLALDDSIFGRAYEIYYMSSDEKPRPKLARLSPMNIFVVYDDTVEQNPVFGVYYYPIYGAHDVVERYRCSFQTSEITQDFELTASFGEISHSEPQPHIFGVVPINEIYNNGRRSGDFEECISLMDAYNLLQSDRINDKEQFVDAFLLITGNTLGEDDEEKTETYNALKREKVLEIMDGDAKWLTRQFDESSVELLKKSISDDIHKISGVPDMSDENFAGNASGVAMKYKLLGLEQKTKTKERYFEEGLRYRLRAFANVAKILGHGIIDVDDIDIGFTRSLPANELEAAQIVATLRDTVPQETLLSLLPFVKDPKETAEQMKEEKAEAIKAQQEYFANTPLNDYDE